MKRIGIAASRIAKENVWMYNGYVVLMASLFSFFIFVVSAFSLFLGFGLLSFILKGFTVFDPATGLSPAFQACLVALAVVVGGMNIFAIVVNMKVK